MATGAIDLYLTYSILKRLVTPFDQWEAYKLGIIDRDGNILIKKEDRRTLEQKNALGYFDVMIMNLKKLLGKIPGGKSRIATFAAALLLLKEERNTRSPLLEEATQFKTKELLNKSIVEASEYTDIIDELFDLIDEEVTTANVAGVKAGDEPPVDPKKRKRMLRRVSMF